MNLFGAGPESRTASDIREAQRAAEREDNAAALRRVANLPKPTHLNNTTTMSKLRGK